MARFTSIGMSRKKFIASAAEEAQARAAAHDEPSAGPSSEGKAAGSGGSKQGAPKGKKRRGRERVKDETGKRIAIGEKKGPDGGKRAEGSWGREKKPEGSWGRDSGLANRARLSEKHAEERRQKRIEEKNSNVTCFACRGVGHSARECPNILLAAATTGAPEEGSEAAPKAKGEKASMKRKGGKKGGDVTSGKCYRCNGTDHGLHACQEPVDPANPTPYATCYICLATGHLASLCPSNGGKGIYVNGGSCKVCGSTAHRAKDCPDDKRGKPWEERDENYRRRGEVVLGTGTGAGADEDDFMVEAREKKPEEKKRRHAPARNGERPMKRMREVGEGGELLEPYAEQGEAVERPSVPLTARKPLAQAPSKPKKVVAF
ncbi:hypothetical protein IAT38_000610 [Cryptococcus sp. DSM 104549]